MDRAGARAELWRRYDAGEISAREVDHRLRLLDRALDDDAAGAALDRAIPLHLRVSALPTTTIGLAVGTLVLIGAIVAATTVGTALDDDSPAQAPPPVEVAQAFPAPVEPDIDLAECPDPEDQRVATSESPPNPALLSDPPFLPPGYELDEEDDIAPGMDPDVSMSVAAGSPAPVEILGRALDGDLDVVVRSFRYASADDARTAGQAATASGCANAIEFFGAEGHEDEIGGVVVTRVIPTTVFLTWLLDDRRVVVSVEADGGDEDDVEEAKALASLIAVGELDAARTPPPLQ